MRKLIIDSDHHRSLKEKAVNLITQCPPEDEICQVIRITKFVHKEMFYVRDIHGVEEITAPHIILKNLATGEKSHSADCDDYAVLLGSLLRSIGFKTRVEAVAVKADRYNHARVSVYINKLRGWLTLEPTKKTFDLDFKYPSTLPPLALEI